MAARCSALGPLAALSAESFFQHSIVRIAPACHPAPRAGVSSIPVRLSSFSQGSYVSAGDEVLESEVRDPEESKFVAFPAVDSDSDEAEVTTTSSSEAASLDPIVPGRTFGRLRINLDLLLYKARCARRLGRGKEADSILRECIRDWPEDGRAYVALGTSLMKIGKLKEAKQLYGYGCQAAKGENAYIWQAWAVLEERTGNLSKARSLFDAATAADSTHAAAWHGWAVLELRADNLKKARGLLLKGLKYCGNNEYLYQTLAILEVRTGQIELARSYFLKATQANSKSAASWLAWALMEAEYGIRDSVRQLFQRGLQAVPKNRYIWQAWARFEAKEGNKDKARQLFQRGIELNLRDVVLLQAYGLFEYDCGKVNVAREIFKRGVLVDSKHQPLWLAWGWMEWKEGNLDVARELYQRSLMVNNRNMNAVRTYQAWGVLEGKDENYGAARALFRSALRLDSQNMPAWMSWAAMEERCGNAVRAEELRTQCLQQRTEVVEDAPWDVNLSEFLGPTLEGLSGLLNTTRRRVSKDQQLEEESSSRNQLILIPEDSDGNRWGSGENFNIDAFLQDKFPWKYRGNNDSGRSRVPTNSPQGIYPKLAVLSRTTLSKANLNQ